MLLPAVSVSTPGAAGCWSSGCKGSAGGAPAPCTVAGAGTGMGTAGSTTTPLLVHHQRTYSFPLSPLPPSTSVRRGSAGTKAGLGLGHSHSGQRASGTSLSSAHCTYCMQSTSSTMYVYQCLGCLLDYHSSHRVMYPFYIHLYHPLVSSTLESYCCL